MDQVQREHNEQLCTALESDRFQQGRGQLGRIGPDGVLRLCCLGVAYIVAKENGLPVEESTYDDVKIFNGASQLPTMELAQWYGWDSANPYLQVDDTDPAKTVAAAQLNDNGNAYSDSPVPLTFPQIAACFRRTYLQPQQDEEVATP